MVSTNINIVTDLRRSMAHPSATHLNLAHSYPNRNQRIDQGQNRNKIRSHPQTRVRTIRPKTFRRETPPRTLQLHFDPAIVRGPHRRARRSPLYGLSWPCAATSPAGAARPPPDPHIGARRTAATNLTSPRPRGRPAVAHEGMSQRRFGPCQLPSKRATLENRCQKIPSQSPRCDEETNSVNRKDRERPKPSE